jgi:alpha-D-ribose 1-methylphosphonate 5-triphosphate synthase subunit PhnG
MQARRRAAMAVLVHADTTELARRVAALPAPPHRSVRAPENGLIMVRGRIGGDGAPFNLGEATVSRAAVRLDSGEVGYGYVLGRDGEKARLIALCDALIQSKSFRDALEAEVVAPLRDELDAQRERKAAQAAATKVDFYTMVRGEG